MNQLYVEAYKSYKHGFILTEQELRRFNELIKDQIKKIDSNAKIDFKYEIKFQNGVVAETTDLNTVLSQENEGSKKLIKLHIQGKDINENLISLYFYDADSENIDDNNSIKYNIRSSDRDWVFVTSSLIEERISKIKRFTFRNKNISIYRSILQLLMLFTFLLLIGIIRVSSVGKNYISDIRSAYSKGSIKDTNELILQIEEKRPHTNFSSIFLWPAVFTVGIVALYSLGAIYFQKLYPSYNFCWGDYLDVFNKKESTRKTVNTVIIIGLIISILGSIIGNKLPF